MIQPITNAMPPLVPSGFLSQTSYASQAMPQNNAVKIDIHNPYASNQPAPCNPYVMPNVSAYAPCVAAQQAYQMPMYAQYSPYMTAPVAPQFVNQMPVAPVAQQVASQVHAAPVVPVAPVQTTPVAQTIAPLIQQQATPVVQAKPQVVEQPVPVVAPVTPVATTTSAVKTEPAAQPVVVVPQPVVTNQPQIINAPQSPVVIPVPTPVVQAPVVEPISVMPQPTTAEAVVNVPTSSVPTANATVNMVAPQQVATEEVAQSQPQVEAPANTPVNFDLNKVVSNLNSTNPDVQLTAIENVAETAQSTSPNAVQLLDTQVMDALGNIIKRDTTQMQAPTPEQLNLRQKLISGETLTPEQTAEANKISEMEIAERNKQFALYTVAILQKLLSTEVEKAQGTKLEMKDLPMINDVVKIAKSDANPMIRASALASLSFIATPENKPLLSIMFEQSKKDADPNVQAVAEEALNKLSQI